MPSPEQVKRIIDEGAYAAGATQCAGATTAWQAAQGNLPNDELAEKYIQRAKKLHEASEELVADLMSRATG